MASKTEAPVEEVVSEVVPEVDPNAPKKLVQPDADGPAIIEAINTLYTLLQDLGRRTGHGV